MVYCTSLDDGIQDIEHARNPDLSAINHNIVLSDTEHNSSHMDTSLLYHFPDEHIFYTIVGTFHTMVR